MKRHSPAIDQEAVRSRDEAVPGLVRKIPFTHAQSVAALPLTVSVEDIAEFVEKLDRALALRQRGGRSTSGI